MNKYKINIIYGEENINDIFRKSLVRNLKTYLKDMSKNQNKDLTSTDTYLSIKNKEISNNNDK